MDSNYAIGILLLVISGVFSGVFTAPFKYTKGWAWENNWLLWSITALIVLPWIVTLLTVPHLFIIFYEQSNTVMLLLILGAIWGVGAILCGLGIDILGIALCVPVMSGFNISVGTIVPIIIKNPANLLTPQGIKIVIGVIVIIIGLVLSSVAGNLKEKALNKQLTTNNNKPGYLKGLIICILAGIIGPFINFGFIYGIELKQSALEMGAGINSAANVIWCILLTGGFIANFLYCFYLLKKRNSIANYFNSKKIYWLYAPLGGALWFFSILIYGMGVGKVGAAGASTGWATMLSVSIVAANVAGILFGEWKEASKKHFIVMFIGLAFLITGIVIIAI